MDWWFIRQWFFLLFQRAIFYLMIQLSTSKIGSSHPTNTNLFHNLTHILHRIEFFSGDFPFQIDNVLTLLLSHSNSFLIFFFFSKLVLAIPVLDLQKFFWSLEQFCTSNIFSNRIIHFSATNVLGSPRFYCATLI